jgi:hypothetical protein
MVIFQKETCEVEPWMLEKDMVERATEGPEKATRGG